MCLKAVNTILIKFHDCISIQSCTKLSVQYYRRNDRIAYKVANRNIVHISYEKSHTIVSIKGRFSLLE